MSPDSTINIVLTSTNQPIHKHGLNQLTNMKKLSFPVRCSSILVGQAGRNSESVTPTLNSAAERRLNQLYSLTWLSYCNMAYSRTRLGPIGASKQYLKKVKQLSSDPFRFPHMCSTCWSNLVVRQSGASCR